MVVQGGGDRTEAICEAAAEAKAQLASCNLPVTQTVTVEITRVLPENCNGAYHCDEQLIQLLPLEAYATYLTRYLDGPFGHLDPEVFFDSILRHEFAHAALGGMPCPYERCPVTQEFVAYTMQIRFLADSERAPFEQLVAQIERPVSRDSVNGLVLMMSPETFAMNSLAYLSQIDDPCGLMDEITKGAVLFDRPFH